MRFGVTRQGGTGVIGDSFGRVHNFERPHARDGRVLAIGFTVPDRSRDCHLEPGRCAVRFNAKVPQPCLCQDVVIIHRCTPVPSMFHCNTSGNPETASKRQLRNALHQDLYQDRKVCLGEA